MAFNSEWRGGTLSSGTGALRAVVSTGIADITSDVALDEIEVLSGGIVDIEAGHSLTINGDVINNGTINLANSASLVQTATADNNSGTGTYNITRNTGTLANVTRYQYWSSPVSCATMGGVFTASNTADFYMWNDAIQAWATQAAGATMTAGKGYITTGTINISGTAENRTFGGDAHNGTITLATSAGNTENILVGNPYPSAVLVSDFITHNTPKTSGTLWFWNHNTQESGGSNTTNDYATRTNAGGTAASSGGAIPDVYIQSCQGFFVEANQSKPTITFENAQRRSGNNTQFFKNRSQETRQRLWLSLSNDSNDFNQILVALMPEATPSFDIGLDGRKFKAHPRLAFYSELGTEELAIQALPYLNLEERKEISLGIDAWITGSHSIRLDSLDNWLDKYSAWVEDKQEDTLIAIADLSYTFEVDTIGTIKNRFALVVQYSVNEPSGGGVDVPGGITVGVEENNEFYFTAFVVNGELRLQSSDHLKRYTLYDVSGRVVQSGSIGSTNYSTSAPKEGLHILQVVRENGVTKTEKLKF